MPRKSDTSSTSKMADHLVSALFELTGDTIVLMHEVSLDLYLVARKWPGNSLSDRTKPGHVVYDVCDGIEAHKYHIKSFIDLLCAIDLYREIRSDGSWGEYQRRVSAKP